MWLLWCLALGVPQATSASVHGLPIQRATPVLLADPAETTWSLKLRTGGTSIEGVVGDALGLVQLETERVSVQADLAAAIFLAFFPGDGLTFGITTLDGLLRLPISLELGAFTTTLEWAHLSAHYADGVRYAKLQPQNLDPYSREYLRLLVCWSNERITPYLAFRQLIHTIPEASAPGLQLGMKFHGQGSITWYSALDAKWNADVDWRSALAIQSGLMIRRKQRWFRLGLAGYSGPWAAGKLAQDYDAYLGALMAFDHGKR